MTTKLTPLAVFALLATSVTLLSAGSGISAWAQPEPSHEEGAHRAPAGMRVTLTTSAAPGGVLVQLRTRKLIWAPEHLSPAHGEGRFVPGEGHGHIYVDGSTMPATIVVGPWTYLRLEPGRHALRVTLNGNDHLEYRRNGRAVQDVDNVAVPDPQKTRE